MIPGGYRTHFFSLKLGIKAENSNPELDPSNTSYPVTTHIWECKNLVTNLPCEYLFNSVILSNLINDVHIEKKKRTQFNNFIFKLTATKYEKSNER